MRDIPVGNGSLLINFDDKYQIRDIYFPHVGQENHTAGFPSRFGLWIDGTFSWIADNTWKRELKYIDESLVTDVDLTNEALAISINCNDTVASHDNIYLRRVTVRNLGGTARQARLFFHQDFRIYENAVGDTAYYDPTAQALVHYKKHRYFLINSLPHFHNFATGRKDFGDLEGTWRDAEDGILNGASTTEGSVDSTIQVNFDLEPNGENVLFYWIVAGTSLDEVTRLDAHILESRPQLYLDYTANYWRAWVNKNDTESGDLPVELLDFYKRSLLIMHTQIDYRGAILAANDSDVTARATDHYSYLWTRDGAFVAHALDSADYSSPTRSFFDLCSRIVHANGYFLQKYNPDGTIASGWHSSWDASMKQALVPIQEDATALVLWALWHHYENYRDIEFCHRMYRKMVVPCADFMAQFRDATFKLPLPSWNLWENRKGIHTFTCATVVAGLRAAARFASLFAETDRAATYEDAANEIVGAMREHLYSNEAERFLRSVNLQDGRLVEADATVDSSLFATFYFGCFAAHDPMVTSTMEAIEEKLLLRTHIGGVARFENDDYVRVTQETTGNPWFICTLWLAEYYIASATTKDDLAKALELLKWTADRAMPSGVLAEQLNPLTGEPVSVSPLTWSHSTFVAAVHSYLATSRDLD